MSEKAKEKIGLIEDKLSDLPKDAADAAMSQYAAHLEGFAEGFAAGQAHAKKEVQ